MPRTKFLARDLHLYVQTGADVVGGAQSLTTPFGVAATDVLTDTTHGLSNNARIRFTALTGGSGLQLAVDYYVQVIDANTFKVATVPDGVPAFDFTTDISAGTYTVITPGTMTPVGGLNTLTHSPATERADTTGFDEQGRPTHLVVQRGDTWEIAGHSMLDVTAGAGSGKDPGQELIEASAHAFATAAEKFYQITDPGANTLLFKATAEVTLPGGGHNEAAAWAASLEVTGPVVWTPAP